MSKTKRTNSGHYDPAISLDIAKTASSISEAILESAQPPFILRGLQSGKHSLDKDEIINKILINGSDLFEPTNVTALNGQMLDIWAGEVETEEELTPWLIKLLEGFHVYKPKSEEQPQLPIDIFIIYDPKQLQRVQYTHPRHNVIADDAFVFKNQSDKQSAITRIIDIKRPN